MRTNPGASLPPRVSPELRAHLKRERDKLNKQLASYSEPPPHLDGLIKALQAEREERRPVIEAIADSDPSLAGKLDDCGSLIRYKMPASGVIAKSRVNYCRKTLVCEGCAKRWQLEKFEEYQQKIAAFLATQPQSHLAWVTLTIPERPLLAQAVERVRKSVLDFLEVGARRKRNKSSAPIAPLLGACWRIEIARNMGNGWWHPHVHMLMTNTARLTENAVHNLWRSKSPGMIVRVVPLSAPGDGAARLKQAETKLWYMLKPNTLPPADRAEAFLVLSEHGARRLPKLFGAKGELYGRQTSDCSRDEPPAPNQHYVVRRGDGFLLLHPGEDSL